MKERPESFEEKTAKRASVAAAPLAAWVLANLQYGQILEQVAPLEREQRQLAEYEMKRGFSFLFSVILKNLILIFISTIFYLFSIFVFSLPFSVYLVVNFLFYSFIFLII